MAFDPQNPVHVIVILVFVAPVLIGLRIVLQSWSANYWIHHFRLKANAACCRARFEQELNYHLSRGCLNVREIRGAYETAQQHIALFPAEADRQLAEVEK